MTGLGATFDPADAVGGGGGSAARASALAGTRERWRMSLEGRALVLVTAILLSVGLAVLFSASALVAVAKDLPGHHYVLRQATGALVGIVAFAVLAKIDAERWRQLAWPLMLLSILLMIAVLFTGKVNGSRRHLFGGSLQPSEFAKFAILVWTPMLLAKKGEVVRRVGKGLMPFAVVIGTLSVLAILEPDYSVAMMFCLLTAVLLFVGGARIAHFVMFGALGLALVTFQLSQSSYVRERIRSFMEGEQASSERKSPTGDQQYQSFVAVGSGGLLGVGFGQGNQQRGWLPLAQSDFIGSVVGEEFGFVGLAGITVLFALYGWFGFRIARNARSPFLTLVAVGLTFTTVFTAFIHLGVVIGLLPNTGLTLPFVSYGRSNLVLTLAMTGILVNIGSERERVYGVSATDPLVAPRT
ncbi:FtsW/RodA/SpoVE family cell cycle protein [Gemmatimonas sp.]|uniref:FtsW/RodA/SpoVE family cell cycle protein n=1 Tax=Gemmatimonas sp. TaxID=1962908 RepID=UPI0025C51C77|nr:FtsW/RodA/SpoVE family cell cycle protein [Gemmatimonas sp.]MCA2996022.1 FtsW/RodA/SpoVE family cell cycle protein [Gemmatimonas sp.]